VTFLSAGIITAQKQKASLQRALARGLDIIQGWQAHRSL